MRATFIVRHGAHVMPFLQEVPAFLWGDVNYNSEGNARWPTDQEWTELDIYRRDREKSAVEITPGKGQHESRVEADSPDDARLAAYLLADRTCGLVLDSDGAPVEKGDLTAGIADLAARMAHADAVRDRFLSPDFQPWW